MSVWIWPTISVTCFEVNIGREIKQIEGNLYGLEIDPEYEMEHNFRNLRRAIDQMLPTGDGFQEELDDLSMIPGMEELFSLLRMKQIYESGEYEVILVDCAPTGETLSLLKFPELFAWYMEKLFPIGKLAMRVLHPVSQKLFHIELPDGKAMNDIERLYGNLIELQELLKNREITSIRLVTVPEKMVVEETKRNYMYLNLYNFNVDGIFLSIEFFLWIWSWNSFRNGCSCRRVILRNWNRSLLISRSFG